MLYDYVNEGDYTFKINSHAIRLSPNPSPPILCTKKIIWNGKNNVLEVRGVRELSEKEFVAKIGSRELARGKMGITEDKCFSVFKCEIPAPEKGESLDEFEIQFADGTRSPGAQTSFKIVNVPLIVDVQDIGEGKIQVDANLAEPNTVSYQVSALTPYLIFFDEGGKILSETKGASGKKTILEVPALKKSTLLLKLVDSENDVIGGEIISFVDGRVSVPSQDEDKLLKIAVSGIVPFDHVFPYFTDTSLNNIFAVRERIVAIIASKYNCITLSRASGYNMALENSIAKIKSLCSEKESPNPNDLLIPSADYLITGHYLLSADRNPVFIDRDVSCSVMINEILEEGDKFKKFDISSDPADYWKIAAPIISAMNLKPKKPSGEKVEKLDETWAILPFSVASENCDKEKFSTTEIEMALQESGKIARLVSREKIDNILKEMKLENINGASENFAGGIARIVGADRVIMGSVSEYYNLKFMLNLHLVDGKNSVVLDTASAVCAKDAIPLSASMLALKLAERRHSTPQMTVQSNDAKAREANVYSKILSETIYKARYEFGEGERWRRIISFMYYHALANLESAYYLIGDDKKKIYDVVCCFMFHSRKTLENISDEEKKSFIKIIDAILGPIPVAKGTEYSQSLRAVARINCGIEYEEAMRIIDSYSGKSFAGSLGLWKVFALYKMGRFKEAADMSEKHLASFPGDKVGIAYVYSKICRETGDEDKELQYLLYLKDKTYDDYFRIMQLTVKLKGPEEAIETYENMISSGAKPYPYIQLELAKCYFETGNSKKAALILEQFDSKTIFNWRGHIPKGKTEEFKANIKDLSDKIGKIDDLEVKLTTAKDVRKFPENYKIYVQPIGENKEDVLRITVKELAEFMGAKVELLPAIPMPKEDPIVFSKEGGCYNQDILMLRVLFAVPPPEDAICVYYITSEKTINRHYYLISLDFTGNTDLKKKVAYLVSSMTRNILTSSALAYDEKGRKVFYSCKDI
nr:hypothetical protein [Victivallales bacterium]